MNNVHFYHVDEIISFFKMNTIKRRGRPPKIREEKVVRKRGRPRKRPDPSFVSQAIEDEFSIDEDDIIAIENETSKQKEITNSLDLESMYRFFDTCFQDLNENDKFLFCLLLGAEVNSIDKMSIELKYNILPNLVEEIGSNNFLNFCCSTVNIIHSSADIIEKDIPFYFENISIKFFPTYTKSDFKNISISHQVGFQRIPFILQVFSPCKNYSIYIDRKKLRPLPLTLFERKESHYIIYESKNQTNFLIHAKAEVPLIIKIQYVQYKPDPTIAKILLNKFGCNVDTDYEKCSNIIAYHILQNSDIPHQINFIEIMNNVKLNYGILCNVCHEHIHSHNLRFIFPIQDRNLYYENNDTHFETDQSDDGNDEGNDLNENNDLDHDEKSAKYLAYQINSGLEFEKEESNNIQNDDNLANENIECCGRGRWCSVPDPSFCITLSILMNSPLSRQMQLKYSLVRME